MLIDGICVIFAFFSPLQQNDINIKSWKHYELIREIHI